MTESEGMRPEETGRENVVPGNPVPESLAPGSDGPEDVGLESAGLEGAAPKSVGSEGVAPEGAAPGNVAPENAGAKRVGEGVVDSGAAASATATATATAATASTAPALASGTASVTKPKRTRSARGVLLIGARIATGTIGVAVALATVAAAGWLPLPTLSGHPLVTTVVPVPADQQRVCASPILRLGSDTGEGATTVSSIGTPRVVSAASNGRVSESPLSSTDSTTGVAPDKLVLPAEAITPGSVPLLAGSQTQSVAQGDFTGLAAAECREASGDTWLVGGSTTTGRTTLLTMSNPGSVIATVTATIYTENGQVAAAGTDGIVVPPGGQRVLSLAGFAPGAVSPVVRVQSTGSQVVADLQQSVVRTLMPGGVDVIGATTSPAKLTVIPGLVLSTMDAIEGQVNQSGYADLAPILRFFVPGTQQANTEISIVPESGTGKTVVTKLTLSPGKVTELPLGGFNDGLYTISVRSDVPLLAAARTSLYDGAAATGNTDFAWFAAAPMVKKEALVAVADGPSPMLHLANPGVADVVVKLSQKGGSATAGSSVTIPAGGALAVPVQPRTRYELDGFAGLMVSVSYSGEGALAAFTVSPTGPAAQAIKVYR